MLQNLSHKVIKVRSGDILFGYLVLFFLFFFFFLFAGNPQQDVSLTKLFSYLVQSLLKSACTTEFAGYVKIGAAFQRGMATAGVESQD